MKWYILFQCRNRIKIYLSRCLLQAVKKATSPYTMLLRALKICKRKYKKSTNQDNCIWWNHLNPKKHWYYILQPVKKDHSKESATWKLRNWHCWLLLQKMKPTGLCYQEIAMFLQVYYKRACILQPENWISPWLDEPEHKEIPRESKIEDIRHM